MLIHIRSAFPDGNPYISVANAVSAFPDAEQLVCSKDIYGTSIYKSSPAHYRGTDCFAI